MAVGFPTKTSFADGNVLPASDLNDITGSLNSLVDGTNNLVWTSFTPTFGGTGWALGNAGVTAKWTQIGKMVVAWGFITFGSTTAKGTGGLTIAVPTVALTSGVPGVCLMTNATLGGGALASTISLGTTTSMNPYVINASGTYAQIASVTSTVPAAWTTGDTIRFFISYEAA